MEEDSERMSGVSKEKEEESQKEMELRFAHQLRVSSLPRH